jgi:hypothetical protein
VKPSPLRHAEFKGFCQIFAAGAMKKGKKRL